MAILATLFAYDGWILLASIGGNEESNKVITESNDSWDFNCNSCLRIN